MWPNHAVRQGLDQETWRISISRKGVKSRRIKSNPSNEVKDEDEEKLLEPLKEVMLGSTYKREEKQNNT